MLPKVFSSSFIFGKFIPCVCVCVCVCVCAWACVCVRAYGGVCVASVTVFPSQTPTLGLVVSFVVQLDTKCNYLYLQPYGTNV